MKNKVSLFLDSGAYSAWSKGVEINMDDYISFIKQNQSYLEVYVNLDILFDGKGSYKNWLYMKERGLSPMPVYHFGEDVEYLKKYIQETDYIGLGGISSQTIDQLIAWLDEVWYGKLVKDDGFPKVKVHGFGVTSLRVLLRYPWYSVDSTSWVLTGRFGSIFVPRYRNGEYIYDENSWKVCVSNRAADDSFQEGKHITTFSPMERDQILRYINDKGYVLGKSEFRKERASYELKLKKGEKWHGKEESDGQRIVETVIERGISNIYQLRDEMNIIYFLDLEKFLPEWPWPFKRKVPKGFFV